MKMLMIIIFMLLFADQTHAKDPCASVLCMAGMFQGSGVVSGCSKAVRDYFSIIMFNMRGGISLNKTFKARGKFLGKCTSGGNWSGMINNKYGRQLGF